MAIRRVDEAPPFSPSDMEGSRGADGNGIILPTIGRENPGATQFLRGVEPNTGKQDAPGNSWPVMPTYATPAQVIEGPSPIPDSSGMNAGATSTAQGWKNSERMSANSFVLPRADGSHSAFGEEPQGAGYDDDNHRAQGS